MRKKHATAEDSQRSRRRLGVKTKTLIVFSTATVEEMIDKGNMWFIRHFEIYFDQVYVACPFGNPHVPVSQGKTTFVSLAKGGFRANLLFVPFRLYGLARKVHATSYFTADQFFSWWVFLMARLLLRAKVCLSPDCMPHELHKQNNRSITGFPMWVEKLSIRLSYLCAYNVVVSAKAGNFTSWLVTYPPSRNKLSLVDSVVHALPSVDFFTTLAAIEPEKRSLERKDAVKLLYVGRLHSQKMVEDLIRMLAVIKASREDLPVVTLTLVGDGEQRAFLQDLARELGVAEMTVFTGSVPNRDLPHQYLGADIFVSPLTGTSMREAGLCALPIVAYDMDWVTGTFVHEETALLVQSYNYREMAEQVIRLVKDKSLYEKLSAGIKHFADTYWSPQSLSASLQQTFRSDY